MTDPFFRPWVVWLARLLASAFAAWALYRFLLRPDWAVEVSIAGKHYTMWFPFWLWESPVSPVEGGVVGEVRWGRSLLFLAGDLILAIFAWRYIAPDRPAVIRIRNVPPAGLGA
jgi:hypothetical protein